MPFIIGLTGKAGAGKTTLAKATKEEFPSVRLMSYGTGIKAAVAALVPSEHEWDRHRLIYGDLKDTPHPAFFGLTSRAAQIAIGQAMRALDEDYWVKRTMTFVDGLWPNTTVIIDDVRQLNEARAIWDRGGVIIKVKGDEYEAEDLPELKLSPNLVITNTSASRASHLPVEELKAQFYAVV